MIDFTNVSIQPFSQDYELDLEAQRINRNTRDLQERLFLSDLHMFATGKLFPTTNGDDLLVVSGISNYAQAITHRLMTSKGEHPQDYTLGVAWYNYLGKPVYDKALTEMELGAEIANEVLKDSRTQSVEYINVSFTDINTVSVIIVLNPTGSDIPTQLSFLASMRGG